MLRWEIGELESDGETERGCRVCQRVREMSGGERKTRARQEETDTQVDTGRDGILKGQGKVQGEMEKPGEDV